MRAFLALLPLLVYPLASSAAVSKADPSPAEIDKIISTFADKELAFAKARENYTYRQTVKINEADAAGTPGGRYEIIEDIIFNTEGKRSARVVRAPAASLQLLTLTPEDMADLREVQPFVLTSKDIDQYYVRYLGRQTVDELETFVFAVKPKKMEPGKRYFSGMIWVDDRDLQIVKTYGRGTGYQKKSSDQQFPKFETYREQIDGKYWFPTYTTANDLLHFRENDVGIKMMVKYEDYKQFKSDTNIIFGDPVETKTPEAPKKP